MVLLRALCDDIDIFMTARKAITAHIHKKFTDENLKQSSQHSFDKVTNIL